MDKYKKALLIIASKPAGFTEYDMQGLAVEALSETEEAFDKEWGKMYDEAREQQRLMHSALNAELENILK
jgi:hypothetical protein